MTRSHGRMNIFFVASVVAGESRFIVRAFAGALLSGIAGHDHTIVIYKF